MGVPVEEREWFTIEFKVTGSPGTGSAVEFPVVPPAVNCPDEGIAVPYGIRGVE